MKCGAIYLVFGLDTDVCGRPDGHPGPHHFTLVGDETEYGRCEVCGEPFTENDERAEVVMGDGTEPVPLADHLIVHESCYDRERMSLA